MKLTPLLCVVALISSASNTLCQIRIKAGDRLTVGATYWKESFNGQYKAGNVVLRVREPDGREAYFDDPANTPVPNSQGRMVTTPSGARFQRGHTLAPGIRMVYRSEFYDFDPFYLQTRVPPSGDYEARVIYQSADGGRADITEVSFGISPTDVPPDSYSVSSLINLGDQISATFTVPPRITGDIAIIDIKAAQVVYSPDINGDNRIDLVAGKPAVILVTVQASGFAATDTTAVNVQLQQGGAQLSTATTTLGQLTGGGQRIELYFTPTAFSITAKSLSRFAMYSSMIFSG